MIWRWLLSVYIGVAGTILWLGWLVIQTLRPANWKRGRTAGSGRWRVGSGTEDNS